MKKPKPLKRCKAADCFRLQSKTGKSGYCNPCRTARWKESDPFGYAFAKLKFRAKERGHEFKLTLLEYKQICHVSGYIEGKGKTGESLSLDRIDPKKGYEIGNLRVITLSANSRIAFTNMPRWLVDEILEAERQARETGTQTPPHIPE